MERNWGRIHTDNYTNYTAGRKEKYKSWFNRDCQIKRKKIHKVKMLATQEDGETHKQRKEYIENAKETVK